MFDHSGDGNITKALSDLLQNLGSHIVDKDLAQEIKKVNVNGDGRVDIDEFSTLYTAEPMEEKDKKHSIREAFKVFDQNRDGFITMEELKSVLQSLGLKQGRTMEDCKEMINKVDADGNGMVNYKEFMEMMNFRFIGNSLNTAGCKSIFP